jgi:hypothetical protein
MAFLQAGLLFNSVSKIMSLNGCHIHLLRIKHLDASDANTTNTVIECDVLDNLSLATIKGEYTTLSYSVGGPKQTEIVLANGLHFNNAFANLGYALRQARLFWRDRFEKQELLLCADQICIDKSNDPEQGHQLNMMREIYAALEQVLMSMSTDNDIGGGLSWLRRYFENSEFALFLALQSE